MFLKNSGMKPPKTVLLKKIPAWLALSPYAVAICALVLTASVVVYSLHNGKRESDSTTQLMLEKGEAVLWAVQGILQARRNGQWLGEELQDLLDQVGSQSAIRYLGLMDNCELQDKSPMLGSVFASDASVVDAALLRQLNPTSEAQFSIQASPAGGALFVVYKSVKLDYASRGRKHRHGRGMMMHMGGESAGTAANQNSNQALVVAYDLAPLQEAQATDRRHSAIMVVILLFLGLVGLLFLYFVHLHHRSRKRVEEANTLVLRQERLAALGTMAAGVAHEVRNPLSAISGAARIIQEAHPAGSEEHSLARLIGQEVTRLDTVVGDLLDVARQDAVQPRVFVLEQCVCKARDMVQAEMDGQQVTFTLNAVPADLRIYADYDRLLQVLLNLFLNALQAMPDGGRLSVTARVEADSAGGKATPAVLMQVTDSGIGMTPEVQDKVFSPYFTGKAHGTGLGLSIVHKIMQAHGGTITVRSVAGAGTTFSLVFPQRTEKERAI